ncbi:MAG: hypothetical protein NTY20_01185 [Candidatus Aenigmarchaeota archaeon]|nr:hypothetical protein [Candidatus Aenigmarchaeota archaeon]
MLELIALWGFLGGLFRAIAGFLSYGKPAKKKMPLVFVITGFVGIVATFAVFYFGADLYLLAPWKIVVVGILVGYVGVDILNSLFEILKQKNINI